MKTDTGQVLLSCCAITLFSLGHWIGAIVMLVMLAAVLNQANFDE